jgi:hypothetical protein
MVLFRECSYRINTQIGAAPGIWRQDLFSRNRRLLREGPFFDGFENRCFFFRLDLTWTQFAERMEKNS